MLVEGIFKLMSRSGAGKDGITLSSERASDVGSRSQKMRMILTGGDATGT